MRYPSLPLAGIATLVLLPFFFLDKAKAADPPFVAGVVTDAMSPGGSFSFQIDYNYLLDAHPDDSASGTFKPKIYSIFLGVAETGFFENITLGDVSEIHGTTSFHRVRIDVSDMKGFPGALFREWVITPLAEIFPRCDAFVESCEIVSAKSSISAQLLVQNVIGGPLVPFGAPVSASSPLATGIEAVPGPLPLLGVGAAFGSIRKLRKFSSQQKTFSMS